MGEKQLVSVNMDEAASSSDDELYIDPVVEARVVRKLDRNVLPILCLFYFLAALDRSNIGNAGPAGLTEALGLSQSQFSNVISLFFVTYIVFELPGTLLLKILKPSRVLSFGVIGWSIVCIGTTFVSSYGSLLACRLLLGLFESWFFPALSVIIASLVYKREEAAIRLGILLSMAALSGAVGGLISYGLVHITSGALAGYRLIFLIEGAITLVLSPIIIWWLPDDPVAAKFFNEEEAQIMKIRALQREKFMGNEHFEWKEVAIAFQEPKTYFSMVIQFCQDTILYGFSTFLPSILRSGLGYGVLEAQYLTIPVYLVASISVLTLSYFSDRQNLRAPYILIPNMVGIVGYSILLGSHNDSVKYFATYLISVPLYTGPGVNIVWTTSNSAPVYRRNTAIGAQQTIGNLSGAIAGQVYRKSPFVLGHSFSLGALVVANICVVLNCWRILYLNKQKLASEENDERAKKTGDYALDFKYCY